MAKRNFVTKIYNKVRKVFVTQVFEPEWQTFLNTVVRVGDLFSAGGPQVTAQQGLTQFKQAISKKSTEKRLSISQLLLQIAKNGGPTSTWHLRVAILKILLHFSRHSKRGGQDVWIYSPPVAYRRWIFEELQGSEKKVLAKLQMEEEIFSPRDKDLMVQALQLALACSQKTQFLLSVPNDHTLAIVKNGLVGMIVTMCLVSHKIFMMGLKR